MSELVKVVARIRPCDGEACIRPAVGSTSVELTYQDGTMKDFPVETVLGEKATQSDVYAEIGPATVDKVLTGYNACILAYGQTGSGKTHTMLGTPEDPGIVFRVLKVLMERAGVGADDSEQSAVVHACAYQVYNEGVYDLLQRDPKQRMLKVRELVKGRFAVPLAVRRRLLPGSEVSFIGEATKRRYLAKTLSNEVSSRSHMVFQMDVTQRFDGGLSELQSTLLLVDLAGSENVGRSGASGDRLKEAAYINKSLTALRTVIEDLSKKRDSLAFRDSQLTKLLKECFGGNALTTLICNMSPSYDDLLETRNTLDFSQTSRKVVNTVQKNVRRSYDDLLREMHRLQELLLDVSCDIKTLQRKLPSDVSAERVTNGTNAKGIPYAFICPLIASNAEERVMDSPVVAADGITYEEQAVLAKWRQEQRLLGPIRVGHHSDLVYFPEKALQAEIDEWVMDKLWPADVLKTIFSFLPCAELVSCSLVCRTWTPPARDDDVWLPHFSNFGTVSEVLQGRKAHKSWAAYHTHTFPNFDQSDGKSALFRGRRSHILYGVSLLSFKEAQRSCEG